MVVSRPWPGARASRGALALMIAVVAALSVACSSGAPAESPGPPDMAQVQATQDALDARGASAPDTVTTWGVDPAAGVVVVSVVGPRTAEVDRFIEGLDPRTLRVDTGAEPVGLFPADGS